MPEALLRLLAFIVPGIVVSAGNVPNQVRKPVQLNVSYGSADCQSPADIDIVAGFLGSSVRRSTVQWHEYQIRSPRCAYRPARFEGSIHSPISIPATTGNAGR
jgi:hypothetical protein